MPNGFFRGLELRPYAGFGIRFKPATRAELAEEAGLGQFPYWFGAQAYINRAEIEKAKAEAFELERMRVAEAQTMAANAQRIVTGEPSIEDRIAAKRIEQVKNFIPIAVAAGVGLLLMGMRRRY